jgi:hypothetical protein
VHEPNGVRESAGKRDERDEGRESEDGEDSREVPHRLALLSRKALPETREEVDDGHDPFTPFITSRVVIGGPLADAMSFK